MLRFLFNLNTFVFVYTILIFVFLCIVAYSELSLEAKMGMKKNKKSPIYAIVDILKMLIISACPIFNVIVAYVYTFKFNYIVNQAVKELEDEYRSK